MLLWVSGIVKQFIIALLRIKCLLGPRRYVHVGIKARINKIGWLSNEA